MTDQSKIPQRPDRSGNGAPAKRADSLLERAVKAFDLKQFAPPRIPETVKPVPKPAMRNRSPERPASDTAPAGSLPASAPVSQPGAARGRRASDGAPASVPAAVPAPPAEPPAPPPAPPVEFTGPRHRVDRETLREKGLIQPEGIVTALQEEFRIIKRQLLIQAGDLRRQGGGAAAQRILICSPHSGEGKTYCAVNLALSMAAEKEADVLLVDADFAKPSILEMLGLPGGPGLMDALTDPEADVASFVIGTDIPGLWVLPAGNATMNDSEYLNSSRTPQVLDRLTQGRFKRMVIFDSPPALAASPAAELAAYVGQAVMVVRADRTGQGALEDAVSLLSNCPNIQLLLNDVHFSPSGRRFGSYYGYGG